MKGRSDILSQTPFHYNIYTKMKTFLCTNYHEIVRYNRLIMYYKNGSDFKF